MKSLKLILSTLAICTIGLATVGSLTFLTSCNEPQIEKEKELKLTDLHDIQVNAGENVLLTPKLYLDDVELSTNETAGISFSLLQPNSSATGYEVYALDTNSGLSFSDKTGALTGTTNASYDLTEKVLAIRATYDLGGEGTKQLTATSEFKLEVVGFRINTVENINAFVGNQLDSPAPIITYKGAAINESVGTLGFEAVDVNGDSKPLPNNVSIATGTGVITISTNATVILTETYCLKITLTRGGSPIAVVVSNSFTITVTEITSIFSGTIPSLELKTGESMDTLSLPTLALTKGLNDVTSEYTITYSLTETLPNGLTFNNTGLVPTISGAPTDVLAMKQYTYSAVVSGGYSVTKTLNFYITITASEFYANLINGDEEIEDGVIELDINNPEQQLSITPIAVLNGSLINSENLIMELAQDWEVPEWLDLSNNMITGYPTETIEERNETYTIQVVVSYTKNNVTFTDNVVFEIVVNNTAELVYADVECELGQDVKIIPTLFKINGEVLDVEEYDNYVYDGIWVTGIGSNELDNEEHANPISNFTYNVPFELKISGYYRDTVETVTWYLKVRIQVLGNVIADIWVTINVSFVQNSEG